MKSVNYKEENPGSQPEISVIIPFYGDKKDLLNCFRGLSQQMSVFPFEVIVVESLSNCNLDKAINYILPGVTIISSQTVLYPGKARNLGVANSNSALIAFIDSDCNPSFNWLSQIYYSLKKGHNIVVGPVENMYPFHPIASVDNLLQFVDFQKYSSSKYINHFPACNLGITKELFLQTEGFPENVVTGEDVLFSQKAINKNGGKVYYNPKQIVQHSGRKNFSEFTKHNESLGFHRGYLNLKIKSNKNKLRSKFLYSFLFGFKRMTYIIVRTLQWNPTGFLRILFYFPVFIVGLSSWVKGFWRGNQKFMAGQT